MNRRIKICSICSALVITIGITSFGVRAIPEIPIGITIQVENGTTFKGATLCSLQQCQCVKTSVIKKVSCDCSSQACELKLMGGSLERVHGLEELELTGVRKIDLESGAFSGQQLKRVSGEVKVV